MIEELFRIGSFSISPFGVALVAAFIAAYFQLKWGMHRRALGDEEDASALLFMAGVGGIVGAKVYYAILTQDWRSLFDRSGLVWYGGFILGAAGVLWMMRPPPPVALGDGGRGRPGARPRLRHRPHRLLPGGRRLRPAHRPAVGRGLPGRPAADHRRELPEIWGLDLPASIPDDRLLQVHPTQLYETAMALAIWGLGSGSGSAAPRRARWPWRCSPCWRWNASWSRSSG
jgi:phosphatidylglycerol---prolipoprotein diacylglyceryl transferase